MSFNVAILIPKPSHNVSHNTTVFCQSFDKTITKVSLICVVTLIMVFGLFVNMSLLILFFRKRHSLSHSNVLLSSLATSNSIACLLVLPMVLHNIASSPLAMIGMVCDTFSFLQQLWWISSNYNIFFISYDKWKSVADSYTYSGKMTQRKAVIFISIIWALSIIFAIIIPVSGWTYAYEKDHYFYSLNWNKSILRNIIYVSITFWIPGIVVFTFHMNIIQNATRSSQRLTFPADALDITRIRLHHDRLIYKTIKTSCLGIFIILTTWLPYSIIVSFQKLLSEWICKVLRITSIMIYLPIVVYPYFFGFRNKKIRGELSVLFSKVYLWRDVRRIHPAPNIDETEYPENVSRRNSRTDSFNTDKRLSQTSSFIGIFHRRESGMTNVDI